MSERSTREQVTFALPFTIQGGDGTYPPGTYDVDISEEQIPGLSFVAFRRTATTIKLPSLNPGSTAMHVIDVLPADLAAAVARDADPPAPDA